MIFKQNMIVVLTNGRLAGKKAVVLKEVDENTIVVAGVNRVPTKSETYMPSWQQRKNAKFLTFIKKVNVNHVLATRYKADIGLNNLDAENVVVDVTSKQAINEKANKIMQSAFEEDKAKWLFTSLKF